MRVSANYSIKYPLTNLGKLLKNCLLYYITTNPACENITLLKPIKIALFFKSNITRKALE
jgi:hypothetical protein